MLGVVLSGKAHPDKHWIFLHGGVFPLSQHHHYYDCCRRNGQALLRPHTSERCVSSSAFKGVERPRGEGSWNVAWDARPARWLYRPESVWLLYGVCACLAQVDFWFAPSVEDLSVSASEDRGKEVVACPDQRLLVRDDVEDPEPVNKSSEGYKVTGVLADGRCLFRAIAHGACLRSGEEAPDEKRERELADKLRARVVEELLKRRKEVEWFMEGDFDAYIKTIEQPHVWGGEPELLMACHVLKTMITVFMTDRSSGKISKIANYGEEYNKDDEDPINVLFHGYGHYDILETSHESSRT